MSNKTSKYRVFVTNSIAVTTGGKCVKCEKVGGGGGLESPSSRMVQKQEVNKMFPFLRSGWSQWDPINARPHAFRTSTQLV
jgi:hypothetical protein